MKLRKIKIEFLMLLAALCLMAPAAMAADVSVGGGVGIAPDYEGSEDYEFVPVPFAKITWPNEMFFSLEGLTAKANLIPSNFWRLGPMANYRQWREDVDNNAVDNMKDVDAAFELGAFAGFEYDGWNAAVEFLADVSGEHDGWLLTFRGGYTWVAGQSWKLSLGAFTTYANEDYMETYFGVDSNNVGTSGFAFYDPDAGFKDVGLDLGVGYNITNNWGARAIGKYALLVGDADDTSPVVNVGDESQFFGALLVVYSF